MAKDFTNPWGQGGKRWPPKWADDDSNTTPSIASTTIKKVKVVVTSKIIGKALTWTYPYDNGKIYEIPTYELIVEGTNEGGTEVKKYFEVIRFGVTRNSPNENSKPYTVGLADKQTHIIKQWLPDYKVHSAASDEIGAWQVYGNFLIHDGPDKPMEDLFASIGCIEICGSKGFNKFNDEIIKLSGVKGTSRSENLKIIGKSGKLSIDYEKASRPPVKLYS